MAETVYIALTDKLRKTEGYGAKIPQELKEDLSMARRMYPILDPGKPFKPLLSGKRGQGKGRRAAYGPWVQS